MNTHTDQPRTPAGSPQGGEFATKGGGVEADLVLTPTDTMYTPHQVSVGDRTDEQLLTVLEHTMVEYRLGDPSRSSDQATLRAAADYMQLPLFTTDTNYARWAIGDVANAGEHPISAFTLTPTQQERLTAGDMVNTSVVLNGRTYDGELFRSSTPHHVWFIPNDPYPKWFADNTMVDGKVKELLLRCPTTTLMLDDDNSDYSLIDDVTDSDEHAQAVWDLMHTTPPVTFTVGQALLLGKTATIMPRRDLPPLHGDVRDGVMVECDGETLFVFEHRGRPDQVRAIPATQLHR